MSLSRKNWGMVTRWSEGAFGGISTGKDPDVNPSCAGEDMQMHLASYDRFTSLVTLSAFIPLPHVTLFLPTTATPQTLHFKHEGWFPITTKLMSMPTCTSSHTWAPLTPKGYNHVLKWFAGWRVYLPAVLMIWKKWWMVCWCNVQTKLSWVDLEIPKMRAK